MKYYKKFKKAFGLDEYEQIDFPKKISNVKISRIRNTHKMGGCSFCFPHGFDLINNRWKKVQRSWKQHRKHQWRE